MTVRSEDGSYRPLDRRTLEELAEADTWRQGMHALRRIEENNLAREEAIDKDFENHIKDVSREHHKQIAKELDSVVGAANVPKEDLRAAVEQRRGSWMGSRSRHPRTAVRHNPNAGLIEI